MLYLCLVKIHNLSSSFPPLHVLSLLSVAVQRSRLPPCLFTVRCRGSSVHSSLSRFSAHAFLRVCSQFVVAVQRPRFPPRLFTVRCRGSSVHSSLSRFSAHAFLRVCSQFVVAVQRPRPLPRLPAPRLVGPLGAPRLPQLAGDLLPPLPPHLPQARWAAGRLASSGRRLPRVPPR